MKNKIAQIENKIQKATSSSKNENASSEKIEDIQNNIPKSDNGLDTYA
ncbi:MAG: hypothetical protein GX346_07160 [Clostridiales bacterium]|nr:hypothetical protein [Clostridiales bacterium]